MDDEEGAADRIDKAIQPFNDLFTYSRKTRAVVVGLICSMVYDVIITVVVAIYAWRAENTASDLSDVLAARAQAACESRNDFKELDLKRWEIVIQVSGQRGPGESPADVKRKRDQGDRFLKVIQEADALEDCSALVANGKLVRPSM